MNDTRTNSGAAAIPYRILKQHIAELDDKFRIDDLDMLKRFVGGDLALELKGERLHLFSV